MARFSKQDIETHREGFGRHNLPAINVKAHNFGGRNAIERLMADFGLPEDREEEAEKALQIAFECAQEDFWQHGRADEAVDEILKPRFGSSLKFYSEGRSGGWLVVTGLGDIADWNAIDVSCWGRFSKRIKAEVEWLCDYDNVKETIEANEWLERDYEKAGMAEIA